RTETTEDGKVHPSPSSALSVFSVLFPNCTCRIEPASRVVDRCDLQTLRSQHLVEVLRDSGRGVLLKDADAPVAVDVILEALELDAPVGRDVCDAEGRKVRQPAIRAHRTEFARLRNDLLVRTRVGKRLQYGDVDRLGAGKRKGPAFGNRHVSLGA